MSSTPIYDELAATYLADLLPPPARPAAPDGPVEQTPPPAAQSPLLAPPHARPQG